jgi:hypothetical protein
MPGDQVVRIDADIRDELLMISVSLLFAFSDLRVPIDTIVTCTDATPDTGARVVSAVPVELAEALYRSTEVVGQHIPFGQSPLILAEANQLVPPNPIVKEVFDCLSWEVERSVVFKESLHVNLRELDEIVSVIKGIAAQTLVPLRKVNGSDSMVSIGAVAKGRSPSYRMNSRLRVCTCWELFSHKSVVNLHLASGDNVADDPTRGKPLRAPCIQSDWIKSMFHTANRVPMHYLWNGPKLFCELRDGFAGLTVEIRRRGGLVEPPLGLGSIKGHIGNLRCIDRLAVRLRLLHDIQCGLFHSIYIGLVSKDVMVSDFIVQVCKAIHVRGGSFYIEGSTNRYLQSRESFLELSRQVPVYAGSVDICTYHRGKFVVLSNNQSVRDLQHACVMPPCHQHGHVRRNSEFEPRGASSFKFVYDRPSELHVKLADFILACQRRK